MRFSVTIPAYKSQYLQNAIESVVSQTYADWELIIVDDCSPEDLRSIVEPFLNDQRIRYYRNEKNCGAVNLVDNWNICLGYCTGDYVICIGDDDRLLPECLNEYRKVIEKYPNLNVYHAWTEIINEQGEVIDLQEPRPEWESMLSLLWNRWDCRDWQFIGDFCYDTAFLKSIGGYHKMPLAWGSDDITAVIAAEEKGIANTQSFCFQYRINQFTISRSTKNTKLKIQAILMQKEWYSRLLEKQATKKLSSIDLNYLRTIDNKQTKFYQMVLGQICTDYIKGNPIRLIKCCLWLKSFHWSKAIYLKWYLSSLNSLL